MSETIETKEVKNTGFAIMASAIKKDFIPSPEEIKSINSFMMCRWISNHPLGVEVSNIINNATDIPIETQYWLVRSMMNNVRYIKYPKKTSDEDKDITIIAEHYKCNFLQAKQYYKILPEEERNKLLNKYKNFGRVK